ncbi:DUF1990 family protein [Rhodococcus gannanensis]|uniref:DUF1990 family protein n=1 Tax=Rhodococcus gannanensis TaxID=1960308 RepID=A0ABW4P1Z9_9NOCA
MTPHGTLTYPEIGQTAATLPTGYTHLRRTRAVGHGRDDFDRAAMLLEDWEMHRRAGLRVAADTEGAAVGVRVTVGIGFGPFRVHAPCEVVYVVDEVCRRGFAYGTLTGHPECGEERFCVELQDDDTVTFTVTAFSRPAAWWVRAAGPIGRAVQRRVTERYLGAL